jgi:hypothetical protein
MAEIFAEHEREYDEAWRAGRRCDEIADEIAAIRTQALSELAEAKQLNRQQFPEIYQLARTAACSAWHDIANLRAERDELTSNYGEHAGFTEA